MKRFTNPGRVIADLQRRLRHSACASFGVVTDLDLDVAQAGRMVDAARTVDATQTAAGAPGRQAAQQAEQKAPAPAELAATRPAAQQAEQKAPAPAELAATRRVEQTAAAEVAAAR